MTRFLFDGNLGLCGGILELHLLPCLQNSAEHGKRKLVPILKVIVPIAGILFLFNLVLISISLKKKQKAQSTSLAEFCLMDDKYPRVSYDLLQGTNGFDVNNLIGKVRYGSVYSAACHSKTWLLQFSCEGF